MLEDDSSCQLAAAAYIVFEEKAGTRGKNLMGKKKVTGVKYIQAQLKSARKHRVADISASADTSAIPGLPLEI